MMKNKMNPNDGKHAMSKDQMVQYMRSMGKMKEPTIDNNAHMMSKDEINIRMRKMDRGGMMGKGE